MFTRKRNVFTKLKKIVGNSTKVTKLESPMIFIKNGLKNSKKPWDFNLEQKRQFSTPEEAIYAFFCETDS